MAEASTLYKLVILYMLRKVTFPLTNAQITEFIVGKEYTDYFHVQEGSESLIDLSFSVPTEEEAEKVCANWPERSQEIYMYILKKLL